MNEKFSALPPEVKVHSNRCQSEELILEDILKSVEKHFTKIPFFPRDSHLKLTTEEVMSEPHENQVTAMMF